MSLPSLLSLRSLGHLPHQHTPPIHVQDLPRDMPRQRRGEEEDSAGDILRRSDALEGYGGERLLPVISVSTQPGATALTRISGASSVDHDLVAEIIAPLLAA